MGIGAQKFSDCVKSPEKYYPHHLGFWDNENRNESLGITVVTCHEVVAEEKHIS